MEKDSGTFRRRDFFEFFPCLIRCARFAEANEAVHSPITTSEFVVGRRSVLLRVGRRDIGSSKGGLTWIWHVQH
jgi:hypothetical protein